MLNIEVGKKLSVFKSDKIIGDFVNIFFGSFIVLNMIFVFKLRYFL